MAFVSTQRAFQKLSELEHHLQVLNNISDEDFSDDLNKAQADRIKYLEDEFLAYKEQQRVDQEVKKDLDEKLDKAAADYKALWVEKESRS